MIFAYADPPYLGQGKKHYSSHHEAAGEYDSIDAHHRLVQRLCEDYPDGWAMSLSVPSLRPILSLCPEDVRICSWSKPFASYKPGTGLAYAWEPVLLCGGRRIGKEQKTVKDWLAENITLKKGLPGAKPERFCFWVFSMLNAQPGDSLVDIFPGTGIVGRAWQKWHATGCYQEIGGARKNGPEPGQMFFDQVSGAL